ncbi:hypothetical protein GCM10012275_48890 [Longimycelium tulufanense]|uniref:Uncharacterized protein n=1 Tax=Longimycelium tulufanense TaxID=907463 RepID=A0A8J3FVY4_9PSEU|nr:hypothetical protein [Longimycelium tulufanense]GGM72510.1 hypothetical protein GCM10012275_48890 [Longimycelium tulufanense]
MTNRLHPLPTPRRVAEREMVALERGSVGQFLNALCSTVDTVVSEMRLQIAVLLTEFRLWRTNERGCSRDSDRPPDGRARQVSHRSAQQGGTR